jgi:hypothetical protein
MATYAGVSLIGFAVDATLLEALLLAGMKPAWRGCSRAAQRDCTLRS